MLAEIWGLTFKYIPQKNHNAQGYWKNIYSAALHEQHPSISKSHN